MCLVVGAKKYFFGALYKISDGIVEGAKLTESVVEVGAVSSI